MEHNWKIYDLTRTISDGVVNNVLYACESDHNGTGVRKIGELEITGSASDAGFIPYTDLTEAKVLTWVTGSVNVVSIENENSSSIASMIVAQAAITESKGTPWE